MLLCLLPSFGERKREIGKRRMRFTWCGLGWPFHLRLVMSTTGFGLTTGDLSARRHENLLFVWLSFAFFVLFCWTMIFSCDCHWFFLVCGFLFAWATHTLCRSDGVFFFLLLFQLFNNLSVSCRAFVRSLQRGPSFFFSLFYWFHITALIVSADSPPFLSLSHSGGASSLPVSQSLLHLTRPYGAVRRQ